MALITDYASLKAAVADWLNRDDLTTVVPNFIQLAEQKFRRDPRVRKLTDHGALALAADGVSMPSALMAVESWYHDGPSKFHRIEVVTADKIGALKSVYGTTGAPRFAALVAGVAKFAPVPDVSYTTKLVYWKKLDPVLSDANTTNWLVTDHPDIYLYGALLEAAPYLKDDPRLEVWGTQLDARLNELSEATKREQFPEQVGNEDPRLTKARP